MNKSLLSDLLQVYHRKLQQEFKPISVKSLFEASASISQLASFQKGAISACSTSFSKYVEYEHLAKSTGSNEFIIDDVAYSLSFVTSNRKKTITVNLLESSIPKPVKIEHIEKLFAPDMQNSSLCQLRKVRIFISPKLEHLCPVIFEIMKSHFSLGYNILKSRIETALTKIVQPWSALYETLKSTLIAAGLGDLYRHLYLIEAHGSHKAHYIVNRERGKHLLEDIAKDRNNDIDPFELATHLLHPIMDGKSFAIKTLQANCPLRFSLLNADYKEFMPLMVKAELSLYKTDDVGQTPFFKIGDSGFVLMYATKYADALAFFLEHHGKEIIVECKKFMIKAYDDIFKKILKIARTALDKAKYLDLLSKAADALKYVKELIHKIIPMF